MKIEKGIRHPIRNGIVDKTKFEIRVTVNAKLRSKVIDRSLGIKEARRVRSEMFTEFNKSTYVDPTKINLSQLVDIFLSTVKTESTKVAYRNNFRQITNKSRLGLMRIDKIKTFDIQRVIDSLIDQDYSNNTINNYFSPISASMNYAQQQGYFNHVSPTSNVRVPSTEPTEVNMWSIEQFNLFLSESNKIADSKGRSNQYHGYLKQYLKMIEFMRYTGCRVFEACGLQWQDFNAGTNELTFVRTVKDIDGVFPFVEGMKTKKSERTIPLFPQATKILQELSSTQKVIDIKNPYIFNLNGKPFRDTSVSKRFTRLVNQLNMPSPFTLRDNRKLFITECLNKGGSIHVIADYCGTSINQISRTYARTDKTSGLNFVKEMSANG